MQYVSQVAGTIVGYATGKIGERLGYLIHYKSNIKMLKEQVKNLQNKRERLQREIDAAKNNLETIEGDVQNWVKVVDELISRTAKFLDADKEKANHRCFRGWCINLWARYKFGKEAFEKTGEITKLQETKLEPISYRPPLSDIVSFSSSKMFEGIKSRKTMVNEIIKALDDENINVIGVCGMGGVGKTTIVEEVCRQAEAEKKFDKIAMVVVSQTPNLTKIQNEVAKKLGLNLERFDESDRVAALKERIKREKKILIVLDDVWSSHELEKIGIPFGEDHKGCKIVVTSRSQDVCNEMDAQTFPIQVLSAPEAWVLFREMVGEAADSSDLKSIAREVAEGCHGLPIAIVTVGRALKNRSKDVWADAARQMKKPLPKKIKGMDTFVYSRLELSYNYLVSEEEKSLFLLCSLFPEDAEIPVELLVRYGIGLRLFQDVDTIEEARVSARALVSTLLSSFLLLETTDDQYVKMHDIVRDVAIEIASNKYMVKAGIGLRDWPNSGTTFQNYSGISLTENDFHELSDGLECPKLQTLLLQRELPQREFLLGMRDLEVFVRRKEREMLTKMGKKMEIPRNFFQGMKDLKVLDMSGNIVLSLPPTISLLTTLRTLCLVNCGKLHNIAFIGTMKQLEILSLSESDVEEVPSHLAQLTNLRLLDLSDCFSLKQIAPGVISRLCKLEELLIGRRFTNWAVGGEEKASLAELKSLSRLTSLSLNVPNADMLPCELKFENLTRFDITIGDVKLQPRLLKKTLGLTCDTRLSRPVEVLLKKTESLLLKSCKGLKNSLKDLDKDCFGELKHLELNGCKDIKYLSDMADHGAPTVAFRNLEGLYVFACDSMSNIVPSNLIRKLQNLEEVIVENCFHLTNAFDLEGLATEGEDMELLSRLEVLELEELPGLRHKWKGSSHFVNLRNLRSVSSKGCSEIRQFFPSPLVQGLVHLEDLKVMNCNNLEEIFGTREEEERMDRMVVVGTSLSTNTSLQNLTAVVVFRCDGLGNIFPPSVAKGLVQLQELDVQHCKMMKAVAEDEKEEETASIEKIVFPRLYRILLSKLDSLTCFFTGRCVIEYPSLEVLLIDDCPN